MVDGERLIERYSLAPETTYCLQFLYIEGRTSFWGLQGAQGAPGLDSFRVVAPSGEPGYYGNLRRYPFHNPTRGGLSWAGYGRGCTAVTGWFVVDRVTYTQGRVTELDLRFEQHCEGLGPALRGAVHWTE